MYVWISCCIPCAFQFCRLFISSRADRSWIRFHVTFLRPNGIKIKRVKKHQESRDDLLHVPSLFELLSCCECDTDSSRLNQ